MTAPAPRNRPADSGAREIRVTVEIDSDELRRHAEQHAQLGNDGVAHVLFTAAAHVEAGGDIPPWVGTRVDDDEDRLTGPAVEPFLAHPAPTPAPVAVPEGGLCDVRGPEMRYPDRPAATIVCHFPHGHGGDHESEDGARWGDWSPRPELAAPSSDTQDALRRLLDRGVGTDLTPTVSPTVDIGWWYDYLRRLDQRWRAEVARIAEILTLERPEPVVVPLPSEAIAAAVNAYLEGPWIGVGHQAAEAMLTAALPHLRLVSEDDEDTVRVPRVLLDILHRENSQFRPKTTEEDGLEKAITDVLIASGVTW